MGAGNFNTYNNTFSNLLGNGITYEVPRFQRNYSWEQDQWEELWEDIQEIMAQNLEHYMGYLVLEDVDNKNFRVIDGQQRLTTLSIIVLAALKLLDNLQETNPENKNISIRKEQIHRSYIGYIDVITLASKNKLILNINNNDFYKDQLVTLRKNLRPRTYSDKLLMKAFNFFADKLKDKNDEELSRFIDTIAGKIFFTVITVSDELNAYKVFETLNARGVRLSPADLLKNFLFSACHRGGGTPDDIDALGNRWERIVDTIKNKDISQFVRTYWNSCRSFVRTTNLFKTIKKEVMANQANSREFVFSIIKEMEESVDIYHAFSDAQDQLWDNNQKEHIKELNIFGVEQQYPLLLAAYKNFQSDDFTRILKAITTVAFRYNFICGFSTGEQEGIYNKLALRVSNKEIRSYYDVITGLKPIYVEDETFKQSFTNKSFSKSHSKRIRYILFSLEKKLSNQAYDRDSTKYTIEHILPQSYSENWERFSSNNDDYIWRLGNLTLLGESENKKVENLPFAEKKIIYSKSNFEITKSIAENNSEWNPDRLVQRQKDMAKTAASIWRISQFD